MMDDIILIRRQSRRRPIFWIKTIFTLGIWLVWWRNNYLALTKRSIVRHTGVFTRDERAIPLNQIQDVTINYGIIRRLLGLGDIAIDSAGTSGIEIFMKDVDKPEEFRAKVFEQIDKFFEDESHNEPEKPKPSDK
jgi:uncharacterized membrane protein YdbT with pleckstrin-like domain